MGGEIGIRQLCILQSQNRKSTQILWRSKVKFFFHFPKIRAGKSVKQVNKIELPNVRGPRNDTLLRKFN